MHTQFDEVTRMLERSHPKVVVMLAVMLVDAQPDLFVEQRDREGPSCDAIAL